MEQKKIRYEEDDDVIDLYELLIIVKKRWKIILFTFLSITTLITIFSFLMTPVYKSNFLIRLPSFPNTSNIIFNNLIVSITPDEAKDYIEKINILLNQKNYKKLQKLLELPREVLKTLKRINVKKLIKGRKHPETISVYIETTYKNAIPEIAYSIVKYLNKNQYLCERLKLQKQLLKEQKNLLFTKLKEMYKLKEKILKKIKDKQSKIIGFNPMEIEKIITHTELQLQNIHAKLKSLKGCEKITDPVIPQKPYKPKKVLMITIAGISSLFLGVFLVFFLEWIDTCRKRLTIKE